MPDTSNPIHPGFDTPSSAHSPRIRPRLGIILIIIGAILGPGVLLIGMAFLFTQVLGGGTQFRAPGEVVIDIERARRYVVWHETRGVFEGRAHSMADLPDGTLIEVFSVRTGNQLAVSPTSGGTLQTGSTMRESVVSFDPPAPGEYRVRISGNSRPAIFYIRPDFLTALLITAPIVGCSGFLGMGLMIGGIILTMLARRRA